MILRWRKKAKSGRHTFSFNGKRIVALPGDVVECTEQALGNTARKYECLGPVEDRAEVEDASPIPAPKQLVLVSVARKRGFYNIINPDNPAKPLNSKPMRKIEAETALDQMLLEIATSTDETDPPIDLESMNWDALVAVMQSKGIEIKDEYENEDDLRDAIRAGIAE